MYNGASLAAVDFGKSPMEYLRNIPLNMKEIKPHVLLSVPALAKNFRRSIETGIRQRGWLIRKLYGLGLKWGYYYHGQEISGERRTYATVACGEADGYTGIFEDPENFWR